MVYKLTPFEIQIKTSKAIDPTDLFTFDALFGKDTKSSLTHEFTVYYLNKYIARGKINKAGNWTISVMPNLLNIRTSLKYRP